MLGVFCYTIEFKKYYERKNNERNDIYLCGENRLVCKKISAESGKRFLFEITVSEEEKSITGVYKIFLQL